MAAPVETHGHASTRGRSLGSMRIITGELRHGSKADHREIGPTFFCDDNPK